jgi:hypothetical protein
MAKFEVDIDTPAAVIVATEDDGILFAAWNRDGAEWLVGTIKFHGAFQRWADLYSTTASAAPSAGCRRAIRNYAASGGDSGSGKASRTRYGASDRFTARFCHGVILSGGPKIARHATAAERTVIPPKRRPTSASASLKATNRRSSFSVPRSFTH